MSFLWDSTILRHYPEDHALLLDNLKKVQRHEIWLPVIVVAELLVTRNTNDFRDLPPMEQLQNWVDNVIR